jgi:hypothetical protein
VKVKPKNYPRIAWRLFWAIPAYLSLALLMLFAFIGWGPDAALEIKRSVLP